MEELPADFGNRLIGQNNAAKAMLEFTGKWAAEPGTTDFSKGVRYAANAIAEWAHRRFGIVPENCPCFACSRPHDSDQR